MLKLKNLSLKRKLLFSSIFVLTIFLTWFLIRFFTIDTNLSVIKLYDFPEAADLTKLYDLLNGDYAIAVDGNVIAGKSFENQETNIMSTASTTKMILGLMVMREKPFNLGESGEMITLSNDDYNRYVWYANHGGSYTKVYSGEEISEYDALLSVFLASSNNMADSLAIWAFGSIDNYRESATKYLGELGITNTTIGEDASGFSDSTTSTAADLAIIGNAVLENPVLAEIVATKDTEIPANGIIYNTNKLLGTNDIIGIKTGYIGDASGYCLVTGYKNGEHYITLALLGDDTRENSFNHSLEIITKIQESLTPETLVHQNQIVGYLDSWWTSKVPIYATEELNELLYSGVECQSELVINEESNSLKLQIADRIYNIGVKTDDYETAPSFWERIKRVFGWRKAETEINLEEPTEPEKSEEQEESEEPKEPEKSEEESEPTSSTEKFTNATSSNCTISLGALMLINPNFTVEDSFIATRRSELVSISAKYGIVEGNPGNGDNLLDAEAAVHINDMINAYKQAYPGHTLETRSCFRSKGTNCGRLCAATGASDHHTGLTCDLLDPAYGTSLDTSTYDQHIDWQWLRTNSYKYGFIDRFPEAWAGGSMSEPLNVDENGSTGLFETWHYRYVGIGPATEIATGKYNNGNYDSLEHYLKSRGIIKDLKAGICN